jgi:hypothetical protein
MNQNRIGSIALMPVESQWKMEFGTVQLYIVPNGKCKSVLFYLGVWQWMFYIDI